MLEPNPKIALLAAAAASICLALASPAGAVPKKSERAMKHHSAKAKAMKSERAMPSPSEPAGSAPRDDERAMTPAK